MNNLTVTIVNPKVKGVKHHNSINECKILMGQVNSKDKIYYIAEESEVDHEYTGTPKKILYDRLRRSSGEIHVELVKVAEKVVDVNGERKEINYKILRLI